MNTQVPLSKALCTTPAVTSQQTVFAKSVNCAAVSPSIVNKNSELVCPKGQFLFGFEDWRANFVRDHLLPVGPVRCCNLKVYQLDNVYDVQPCQCSTVTSQGNSNSTTVSSAVTCGQDQLIVGFPNSRYGLNGRPLPSSPTQCCNACLGGRSTNGEERCR